MYLRIAFSLISLLFLTSLKANTEGNDAGLANDPSLKVKQENLPLVVMLVNPGPPPHQELAEMEAQFTPGALSGIESELRLKIIRNDSSRPEDLEQIKNYALGEIATTVFIDKNGKPIGADLGVMRDLDSLKKFTTSANSARAQRDALLTKASTLKGLEAASTIDAALKFVPGQYWLPFFESQIKTILEEVKNTEDPLLQKYKSYTENYERESQAREFLNRVFRHLSTQDFSVDDFLKAFDEEIQIKALTPTARQLVEMHRFRYLAKAKRYDQALIALDAAEKFAPGTNLARNIPKFRERTINAKKQEGQPAPQEPEAAPKQ